MTTTTTPPPVTDKKPNRWSATTPDSTAKTDTSDTGTFRSNANLSLSSSTSSTNSNSKLNESKTVNTTTSNSLNSSSSSLNTNRQPNTGAGRTQRWESGAQSNSSSNILGKFKILLLHLSFTISIVSLGPNRLCQDYQHSKELESRRKWPTRRSLWADDSFNSLMSACVFWQHV